MSSSSWRSRHGEGLLPGQRQRKDLFPLFLMIGVSRCSRLELEAQLWLVSAGVGSSNCWLQLPRPFLHSCSSCSRKAINQTTPYRCGQIRSPRVSGRYSRTAIFNLLVGRRLLLRRPLCLCRRIAHHLHGWISYGDQDLRDRLRGVGNGLIGGNQLNVLLLRWFTSQQIFFAALLVQVAIGAVFYLGMRNQVA